MLPWHTTGLYDAPEDFDLTVVSSADLAGSYEFDKVVVWRTNDGRNLIGHDSGCSCPIPFENHRVEDLTEVKTLADVADFARSHWSADYYSNAEVETGVADLVSNLTLG